MKSVFQSVCQPVCPSFYVCVYLPAYLDACPLPACLPAPVEELPLSWATTMLHSPQLRQAAGAKCRQQVHRHCLPLIWSHLCSPVLAGADLSNLVGVLHMNKLP